MRCTICKKTSDEIKLFKGIRSDGMVIICELCAEKEGIPLIKKPSKSQLNKADERYSVRERMERISGFRNITEISNDQIVTQGNLAKLRMPTPKQHHKDVLDNYYWTLNIARRRKKLSITQLAEKVQISSAIIQGIEKGKLPENFEELFLKIEIFLGIKLLKNHKNKINFTRTRDGEQELLKEVQEKMGNTKIDDNVSNESENNMKYIEKHKKDSLSFKEKLSKDEVKLSRREDLSNITLNDLVDIKKEKRKEDMIKRKKIEEEAMLGDDLELELL